MEHVSEFSSLLGLNNNLSFVFTTFCLSVHLSMDTGVASNFELL